MDTGANVLPYRPAAPPRFRRAPSSVQILSGKFLSTDHIIALEDASGALGSKLFRRGSFYCYRNASEREGKADVTFGPNLYTIGSRALFFSCFFILYFLCFSF